MRLTVLTLDVANPADPDRHEAVEFLVLDAVPRDLLPLPMVVAGTMQRGG
jgi:hypothetical protein